MRRDWTHYAAPAAFLLAVTVAVILIRAGMTSGDSATSTALSIPTVTRKTVAQTTTKKTSTTAAPRFYTVVAGDTFQVISSKTGVQVARIQALNPNVESTALYIGQRIRIR